ncbi:pH regulation protein F [Candidatus Aerophobetes bacterium]|nr:pH regulation protein F [Candidatus Aerophobetes bacterium]
MDIRVLTLDIVIFILMGISVLSMVRVVIGPTSEDRMIGLNLVLAQISAILVLIAVKYNRSIYLDVALVYAILGFIGILAIARHAASREDKE